MPKTIAQGAEAKILLLGNFIIKDRIKKGYRLKELDEKIRSKRSKKEAKLLLKASQIINCPKPIESKESNQIKIPYIKGKRLSDNLDKFSLLRQRQIIKQIGESVVKLHESNIIHGDLTTSNMILSKDKVYFIDFGLGFISHRYEDKAVDIHLFRQALESRHFKNFEVLFKEFIKVYKKSKYAYKVLNQLIKVEKRGRYKH